MRHNITNGTWFDSDKATVFKEGTRWNGNNHISLATGSQWEHEELFCTAGGAWVLHHWSQWQGSEPRYDQVDEAEAAAWLRRNEHHEVAASLFPAETAGAEI